MTSLTIELPDEHGAALAAKAHAKGLSAEEYARQVLEHDLALRANIDETVHLVVITEQGENRHLLED
jgi:plasmid stability protein